jgi:hypothetical protein
MVTFYNNVQIENPNDDIYWIFTNHIHIDSSIKWIRFELNLEERDILHIYLWNFFGK